MDNWNSSLGPQENVASPPMPALLDWDLALKRPVPWEVLKEQLSGTFIKAWIALCFPITLTQVTQQDGFQQCPDARIEQIICQGE